MSKRAERATALQNFKKAWKVFGIHPTEKVVDKHGDYAYWEKDPQVTKWGGKNPEEGWGLLSQ